MTVAWTVALAVGLGGSTVAADPDWEWQHPPFHGADLHGVWGSGPNDVYAVGENGTIVHYAGAWWSTTPSGTTATLYDVWGSGRADVFAVGDAGTILHYDGTDWSAMDSTTTQPLNGVWGSGPNDVFAVGGDGTILHYDGSTWSVMSSGTTEALADVWSSGPNDAFAVGGETILHYDGIAWSTMEHNQWVPDGGFSGVWGSGPNTVFAVTGKPSLYVGGAAFYRYDGALWSEWNVRYPLHRYQGIGGNGPNDVFVVGYDFVYWDDMPRRFSEGGAFRYCGGTLNLSKMDAGTKMLLNAVWCAGPDDVFAVGAAGTILRYDGSAWSAMVYAAAATDLLSVWGSGPDDVFAVGGRSTALHLGSSRWERTIGADGWHTYEVWGSGPDDVYVSAYWWDDALLYPYPDPFVSWEHGEPALLYSRGGHLPWSPWIWEYFAPCQSLGRPKAGWSYAHNHFFVTCGPDVWHHEKPAGELPVVDTGASAGLTAISGNAPNDVFAVGPGGGIVHYDGSSWSVMDSGTEEWFGGVWCSGPNDVFVVGGIGTILRYDGSAWSAMTSGTDQTLYGVWGSGPNDVYAVGAEGTILRYQGAAWLPMDSGTDRDLHGVWGSGPNDVYAVGDHGTILHLGGWTVTADVQPPDLGTVDVHYAIGHRRAMLMGVGKPGGLFSHWTGDVPAGHETDNPLTLNLEQDRAVTAIFEEEYILTVHVDGQGQVEPDGGTYEPNTPLSLIATADAGWHFVEWLGDMTGSANPGSLTMDADKTVTAVFQENPPGQCALTVIVQGQGSVDPNSGTYDDGTELTLTATPADGWHFVEWQGDLTGSANPGPVSMNTDKTITAVFEQNPPGQCALTVIVQGQGSVDPNSGTYDDGTQLVLAATPAEGWRFVEWQGDMPGPANPAALTMNADKTITAVFAERPPPSRALPCVATPATLMFLGMIVVMLGLRRRLPGG